MLAMAGGQREVMAICVASLGFQLLVGVLVVGRFGPEGVASVTACGMVLQGTLGMLSVHRRWGIWTSPLAPASSRVPPSGRRTVMARLSGRAASREPLG
jgi:hypothetical protein